VTPKDFLQCLTLEHVKTLLRNGESVLDAALNAGLSGPGRLQDFCVALDAASPGDMKGGAGIAIKCGFAATPFGEALIGETSCGISHLLFIAGQDRNGARDLLESQWPDAKLHRTCLRAKDFQPDPHSRRQDACLPHR
jgi:AraC family transcriptional regulator of adaptative response/methylated-DNA-[protein]-cysteine methyltransferase